MRSAIIAVAGRRRHAILQDEPGVVRLRVGRGPTLDVAIPYHTTGFDVQYENSLGLELREDPETHEAQRGGNGPPLVDENGRPLLDGRYVGWMRRLRVQIEREVASQHRAQVEAQQREAQRERDIAIAQQRAEEASLERARVERMPPVQPAYGPGVQGPDTVPLQAGFNVTRQPTGMGAATIVVVNQSAEHLHRIAFRTAGRGTWRSNQLSRTVPPGGSFATHGIAPGRYELRIEDRSSYKEWNHLNVQAGGEYTLVVTSRGWYRR